MPFPQHTAPLSRLIAQTRERWRTQFPPEEADAMIYWLCNHLWGLSKVQVQLDRDREVDAIAWEEAVSRLSEHLPVQYLSGKADFYGLVFHVNPGVLIPRPETEELVDWILSDRPEKDIPLQVVDLGTGSGCIALTLGVRRPMWQIHGADVSDEALTTARQNQASLHTHVTFHRYDMLSQDPLPDLQEKSIDLIVSNPPYVSEAQKRLMSPRVVAYEPHVALFPPDDDVLLFYRSIARIARQYLKPDGAVYVEINEDFAQETCRTFRLHGFQEVTCRDDLNGKPRMIRASF